MNDINKRLKEIEDTAAKRETFKHPSEFTQEDLHWLFKELDEYMELIKLKEKSK